MEDDGAGKLDLGQQVKVSQNEEDLALLLKLRDHVLLVRKQVIVHVRVAHVLLLTLVASVLQEVVLSVLPISEREHVVPALDDKQREVKVGQLEIDIANLAFSLCGRARARLLAHVDLLSRAALVDRHAELVVLLAALILLLIHALIRTWLLLLLKFTISQIIHFFAGFKSSNH